MTAPAAGGKELKMEQEIRRFTLAYSEADKEFLRIVTRESKAAKIPDGYHRCGKSFLGIYHGEDDYPPEMQQIIQ